jgi:hypothetical protein
VLKANTRVLQYKPKRNISRPIRYRWMKLEQAVSQIHKRQRKHKLGVLLYISDIFMSCQLILLLCKNFSNKCINKKRQVAMAKST